MPILKMTKAVRKNETLAFLVQHRTECAEIARSKLRQGRAAGLPETTLDLLADWAAGFVTVTAS